MEDEEHLGGHTGADAVRDVLMGTDVWNADDFRNAVIAAFGLMQDEINELREQIGKA